MSKRLHVDVASSEAGETTPPIKSPRSSSPRRASFLSDSPRNFYDDDQQNPSEDDTVDLNLDPQYFNYWEQKKLAAH